MPENVANLELPKKLQNNAFCNKMICVAVEAFAGGTFHAFKASLGSRHFMQLILFISLMSYLNTRSLEM